jgi:acetoacetate decarboxylase
MGFVKSSEEVNARISLTPEFYDAEALTVYFQTTDEVAAKLLPPPLKPASQPLGVVFIANYPKTNWGLPYYESAICLSARHGGEEGIFVLSMPVTNDLALILGREIFGYPKKMAEINLEKEGSDIRGWTERHGIRFIEIKAKMSGKFNNEPAQKLIMESLQSNPDLLIFNFKCFGAPERNGFDYNPRLMKEIVTRKPKRIELGEAELIIRPSEYDPWDDVIIKEVFGATYTVSDMIMLPGKIVAEADPGEFLPYAYMKVD